ncbi:MAG TPA: MFS transporter [Candidatus Limnocylindria bacterium]|nr:MFS transporter [Candidatus Limnocylindria bacterium]
MSSSLRPQLRVVRRASAPTSVPAPGGGGGFRRGFSALAHRNYRLYISGQIVSLVGTWMHSVSQPWLVLLLGGTPIQLGIVLALQFAPPMLLAPLGGVLADRIDKRQVIIGAQIGAMLQSLMLFALTATGVIEIWHVYVLATFLGIVSAVEMPVRQAFAAELVPREDLVNAIALNSATFNAARVVGPAVAGVTLALWGPAVNFGINGVSYLAVLAGLWMMNPTELYRAVRPAIPASVRSSLAEGFRYAKNTPSILWPLVLLGGVAMFGMNFQTLLPLYARNQMGMDAGGYGALYAAMGVGSLFGSLWLAFSGNRRALAPLILGGGAVFIAFLLVLGLFPVPISAFPTIVVIGIASMLMVNTINVTIQNGVTDELRGRVMSLYVLVFAGSAPIGGLLAGTLAQLFGAAAAFIIGALASAVVFAVVAWQLLSKGALRNVGRPAPVSDDEAWTDERRRAAGA